MQKREKQSAVSPGYQFAVAGGVLVFRPVPVVMTLVMVVAMIALGCWQLQRLHWKDGLIAAIEAHKKDFPVNVQSLKPDDAVDYRPALALGAYDQLHNFYLISTSLKGEGGYHVLTPFQLFDGTRMMVDRGWVPYSFKDKPDSFGPPPSGGQMVRGVLRVPQHGWFQPSNRPDSNDWYWPDLMTMARVSHAQKSFLPYVLELNASPNVGSYPIGGQTRMDLPNHHLEYALTWFALAAALTIIFGIQSFNRTAKH